MKRILKKGPTAATLIGLLVLGLCGGCGEMEMHPIYKAALGGALIGAIIGHDSGEEGEGALLGAAILATGCLLEQLDEMPKEEKIIVNITNADGSKTAVMLKKRGGRYVGPKGEHYEQMPTEDQLRPLYGKE
jgi:hypothetical protein